MSDPTVTRLGDTCYVTTDDLILEFSSLREHSDGLTSEVTATLAASGRQHWARLNMSSTAARATYAKALVAIGLDGAAAPTLDSACLQVQRLLRTQDPARPLEAARLTPGRWLLDGLLPVNETSVLFGDGGSGKSWLALALAVAGLTGCPVADSERWRVAPLTAVLYLDWESQYEDHAARLWGLSRPHTAEETGVPGILHRTMTRPLTESISTIRHDVDRHHVSLAILDSLGAACGAEPEGADAAVRTMNALRSLPCTRLVIAHVSKVAADAHTPARPYGSVYVANLARSTIEARRDESCGPDELSVTYYHRKANHGSLRPPTALRFLFDDAGHVLIKTGDPDLERAGLPIQILDVLKRGSSSASSIAETINATPGAVRTALGRLAKRNRVLRVIDGGHGKGQESQWGLVDTKRLT